MASNGMMKCATIFSSKTFSGYKLDVIKSGVQKYARRREREKMIRCMVEMDKFSEFGKKGNGIRSNMMNRLKVMCYEELCFSDISSFLRIMNRLNKWDKGGRKNRKLLVEVCDIFVKAELLRLASDIKNYYWWGVRDFGMGTINKDNSNANMALVAKYRKPGDDESVLRDLAKMVECMKANDDIAFYWMVEIILKAIDGVKGARRWRRTDCDYIIWEMLCDQSGANDNLVKCLAYALKEYFKKNRTLKGDRTNVIVTATLWVMRKTQLDWKVRDADIEITDEQVEQFYNLTECFFVDDYVLDKHCSAGRRMGKTTADFAKVGSLVINENKEWYVDEYRKAYIEMKMSLEDKLEEIDFNELENLERCEEKTCGNKAMCWFADYRGKRIVLKEGRKSMNYNRDYMVVNDLKNLFGVNKMAMKRVRMHKVSQRKDKTKSSWVDNSEWVDRRDVVYCMMDRVEGGQLIKKKGKMQGDVMKEFVKIGLFRGIFRVSDFHARNVLIEEETDRLFSIDEHCIGKKETIFDARLAKRMQKQITKEVVDDIFEAWENGYGPKEEEIIEEIQKKMKEYKFDNELTQQVIGNYKNLREQAYLELGFE